MMIILIWFSFSEETFIALDQRQKKPIYGHAQSTNHAIFKHAIFKYNKPCDKPCNKYKPCFKQHQPLLHMTGTLGV